MRTVTIVGVGRVGGALSVALDSSGYQVNQLVSNDLAATGRFAERFRDKPRVSSLDRFRSVKTELLFITTQDSNIRPVSEKIAGLGSVPQGTCAFHCSGALSSGELSALGKAGYRTASAHPLVSVSSLPDDNTIFSGVYFALEGDAEAVAVVSELVSKIGGTTFEIDTESKSLYHAAAVVASGHLTALFETSVRMLVRCGMDTDTARTVMLPLVESTVANLSEKTPAESLTGPFARGDISVITGHLQKLNEIADENIESVYRSLGLLAIELASQQGVDDAKTSEMRKIILLDKSNFK